MDSNVDIYQMTNQTIHIAVIVTCHNRKEKTIASLRSVFNAQEFYNSLTNLYKHEKNVATD